MNSSEAQLKSWKPRRPSASISRRLFAPRNAHPELGRALSWCATATACLLLTVGVVRHGDAGPAASNPLVAMIWSNQAPPSYFVADTFQSENRVIRATLASTNPGQTTSVTGFTQKVKAD